MAGILSRKQGRSRAARSAVAMGVASVALGAAACGGGGSASGPATSAAPTDAVLQAAVSKTAATDSVALNLSAVTLSSSQITTLYDGSGSFDLTHHLGTMTMSSPALGTALGNAADANLSVVMDGANLYLNVPALGSVTGGKSWFSFSLASILKDAGAQAGTFAPATLGDPSTLFALLAKYGGTVTSAGQTPDAQGKSVTQYEATIPLNQIVAQIASDAPQLSTQAITSELQQAGLSSLLMNVWVGSNGLLDQIQVTMHVAGSSPGADTSTITETIGFSNYGAPVKVTPPPASQVIDLNQLLAGLGGSSATPTTAS